MNANPSVASLWASTARVAEPLCTTLVGDFDTDVVVIGGGFTGLSAALHLAEAGAAVCLLEADGIGHGASGRNGGQVNPGLKLGLDTLVQRFGEAGRGLYTLVEEATDFLSDLIMRKNLRCQFVRPGVVRLAHSTTAMAVLAEAYRGLKTRGIAGEMLSSADVEALVGTRRYLGGLIDPRGGNLHPLDLARDLANAAMAAGTRVFTNSRALSLSRRGERWEVRCAQGSIRAQKVLIATNGYSDQLISGLARSLLPVNSYQIATEPIGREFERSILPGGHAVYDSRRLVLYFRKSPDGRVMLGGRASFSSNSDGTRAAADYDVLVRVLHDIYPQLKGVGISHRWTGLVCMTPDFVPHYHEPEPGIHIALGFNGRGVALATRTGAWVASMMLGRTGSGSIPKTSIAPIPFHAFREPALNVVMLWNSLMDKAGR